MAMYTDNHKFVIIEPKISHFGNIRSLVERRLCCPECGMDCIYFPCYYYF